MREVRVLGDAGPRSDGQREWQMFQGTRHPTEGGLWDSTIRLHDMDDEGVDVQLVVPQGYTHPDPVVQMELLKAEHRFLDDFAEKDPHRLKTLLMFTPGDVEGSVAEIHKYAGKSWAVGLHPVLPIDYPVDHPDLEPIWAAADEANLCVVHHSFAVGYPGYRDLWHSPYLGRLCSHPWGAMRFVGAFFGSGIMDRHENLRCAVLESGFGWLPFWAARMDEQVGYVGFVADGLKMKPSEYMTSGRFFCSIVLHEGVKMVEMVTEMLGEDILMFGSDYPHSESHFPNTVDDVLEWESLSPHLLQKLMWDTPVRAFGAP
jgi:predicted TIM-barrel fold metal-dependent hydrolase